jgi:alkylated DNA nucleotide flippase Atl1
VKASETTLRSLLQGERQYVVPLYQRRYSWERKDLDQLWHDLVSVADGGSSASHFLGSVVLAPSPTNTPAGVQVWLVVDGQQRLTTLSILLCAIRDHVRAEDARLAEKIDDLYLFNRYASGQERYTLLPTQADRASWIALLEQAPDAGGEDRIGEAYHFFRKELVVLDDPEDPHDIARIEQAIAGQLSIVEIAAHPDDNVHRIFESLNHTGQPLTQADLLRNYLFMRLPTKADHVYERQWLPLQELLTNKQLEELVWLDLVLRGDDRATQEAIYQSQQQHLDKLPGEAEIEAWITELHHKARLFRKVLAPDTEADPVLRRALDRLKRWAAQVVHPIALRVMVAHHAGRLDVHEAARALRVVEGFLVRRMIVGIGTTGTNRILMTLVKELGDAVPTAEEITRVLSGPRKKFPADQHVREAVLVNNFYWTGRGPQRTFVLRCLEEDYRHGEPIDFANSKLTIEHVLPQSPTQEWRNMLAEEVTGDESPEELHSKLVHTLGNLSLTAYNSKLANDGFAAKKQILDKSGLAMNREIADAERWGAKEIRERGRALAERALRIWPGPIDSADTAPVEHRWRLMNQILASIPAGRWTSYSDVAEVIGTHQVPVGTRLASVTIPNAHRVLKLSGDVSPEFRWPDPDRTDDPRMVLRSEGVRFDSRGRASAEQRLTAAELAVLVDLDVDVPEVEAESEN